MFNYKPLPPVCMLQIQLTLKVTMLLLLALTTIFKGCATQENIVDNVILSGNRPFLENKGNSFICPQSSYYFRCDVTISRYLQWSVSGHKATTIYPYSETSDIKPQDPLNILIQRVSLGAAENQTNFTSYLWFNPSLLYPTGPPDVVIINCSSAQHSKTVFLKTPGSIGSPTDVTCDATINAKTQEVTGKCGWEYAGDLSLVAYFNLEIFLNDQEVTNVLVQNNKNQAVFTFLSSDQSANYKAIVHAINHCNTQFSSLMFTGSATIKQDVPCDCEDSEKTK